MRPPHAEDQRTRGDGLFPPAYPHVPLIVLTGYPDTDLAVSCMREGVVDYLVKPVDGDRLRAAVGKAMEQRELPGDETEAKQPGGVRTSCDGACRPRDMTFQKFA